MLPSGFRSGYTILNLPWYYTQMIRGFAAFSSSRVYLPRMFFPCLGIPLKPILQWTLSARVGYQQYNDRVAYQHKEIYKTWRNLVIELRIPTYYLKTACFMHNFLVLRGYTKAFLHRSIIQFFAHHTFLFWYCHDSLTNQDTQASH